MGELGMTEQWGQGKRIVLPTSSMGEDPFPNLWNSWFFPALQQPGAWRNGSGLEICTSAAGLVAQGTWTFHRVRLWVEV